MRKGFLRAICERPRDNLLRLVFADWLDEQGEQAYAIWIRRQVALPGGFNTARGQGIKIYTDPARTTAKINFPAIPNAIQYIRRGFVDALQYKTLQQLDFSLFAIHPIRNVSFDNQLDYIEIDRYSGSLQGAIRGYAEHCPYSSQCYYVTGSSEAGVILTDSPLTAERILSHAIVDYAREQVGLPCIWKSPKTAKSLVSPSSPVMELSYATISDSMQDVPLSPWE